MTPADSPARSRGYVIATTATLLWSTTAIFIRTLTNRAVPPLVIGLWREVLVAVAMLIALAILRPRLLRLPRAHWPFMIVYGAVLMVFNAGWTVSVALNGAAVSTVLAYSSPALTSVLAWLIWREALGPFRIAAVVLSLAGAVLVSGAYDLGLWRGNPLGIGIGLLSGLMFAFYSICGRETARRGINPWTALMVTFGLAALFFLIPLALNVGGWSAELTTVGGLTDVLWLGADWQGWLILIILAWGPTLGGYGLYALSLNYLPTGVANLIASLEPGLTALLAFALLGESLSGVQIVGTILIVGGVLLLRVESLAGRRKAAQTVAV